MCSKPRPTRKIAKTRVFLTVHQASEIYLHKIHLLTGTDTRCRGMTVPLAKKYAVPTKTIRDIWNRKTWANVTQKLWHLEKCQIDSLSSDDSSIDLEDVDWSFLSDSWDNPLEAEVFRSPSFAMSLYQLQSSLEDFKDPFHDDYPFWDLGDQTIVDINLNGCAQGT